MKSSVDKLSETRVKVTVEVPFEELTPEIDAAYKALAQQIQFKGFRKGKAPRKLIDARVGRGPVLEQVVNDMLPKRYSQAIEENNLRPLGQPAVDVTKLEDGELVEFTAEVDVRPEITVPDFSTISVTVPALTVTDEDVDHQLTHLRERFSTLKPVGRKSKKDDIVVLDISATVDGKELEEVKREGFTHVVSGSEIIKGLNKAVRGAKAGETVTFTTDDFQQLEEGQEAEVTVEVKEVKERVLPELDDDFAQEASQFDTVEELREDTRTNLQEQGKMTQASNIRDEVLQAALDQTPFELPETVVDEQVQGQMQQLLMQFGGNEEILDQILQSQGTSREDFDKESRESAENAVRTQLFLDQLVDEQKPQITQEEINEHIVFTAQRYGMTPQDFIQQITQSGQTASLIADVQRGKALAAAICETTVTDEEGNAIDPNIYFGEIDEDADSADNDAEAK